MSAMGAQKGAAGLPPAASWMHSYPPVFSGAAATSGLNARAAANTPAPTVALIPTRAMVPDMFFPIRRELQAETTDV